ncbi:hypothetical protein GGI12_001994 [Dipsacomyces acuminosporus]|nr:hypothetical protein GGI12_001994 [Dipsacomyces acuminosporus]
MSAFHNDIFNRRSSVFLGQFDQSHKPGVFAPPAMPRPLFGDSPGQQRRSSFSEGSIRGNKQFAYLAGCEICEEESLATTCQESSSGANRINIDVDVAYKARTEESVTDSKMGNGRVRARSATTMVGDSSFGFANMDVEMQKWAADNRWRNSNHDSFYGRPFSDNKVQHCPPEHMRLREDNVGGAFSAHRRLHDRRQADMHADANAYFSGQYRPHHSVFGNGGAYGCRQEEEEEEVKVTTTTTTTTTTTHHVEDDKKDVCKALPSPPPRPPTPTPPKHHHHHHHHAVVIPVGTKPDAKIVPPGPCCTWCKFLPCLDCPKPTNPNARFKKENFRLFPEYEFLPDHLDVPKPTEYFPDHVHAASRTQYKITIPGALGIAQRIYVDFVGDQMVILGEHGKPLKLHHHHLASRGSTPTMRSTRSASLSSKEREHVKHFVPGVDDIPGVSKVFAKNFFLPRDTYDRDRAQVFIKPNGKLKIVVPVIGM